MEAMICERFFFVNTSATGGTYHKDRVAGSPSAFTGEVFADGKADGVLRKSGGAWYPNQCCQRSE
jgi:hypothetical protein